jgi:hypothetical protein
MVSIEPREEQHKPGISVRKSPASFWISWTLLALVIVLLGLLISRRVGGTQPGLDVHGSPPAATMH